MDACNNAINIEQSTDLSEADKFVIIKPSSTMTKRCNLAVSEWDSNYY